MTVQERLAEQGLPVRRFECEDAVELTVDFGPGAAPSVNVVGDTAIVVADGSQYGIEVGENAKAFISNGILTIEVEG